MSGKSWKVFDIVLGLIGGICGVAGIVTSAKSSDYDDQRRYEELEERYGLTPVNKEDN